MADQDCLAIHKDRKVEDLSKHMLTGYPQLQYDNSPTDSSQTMRRHPVRVRLYESRFPRQE